MPTDSELMEIHVRALFTHNSERRLLCVNEPDNTVAPAPRLFLGRTQAGSVWRFRADSPEKLCEELNMICASEPPLSKEFNEPPRHLRTILSLIESAAPVQKASHNLAYRFTKDEIPKDKTAPERLMIVTEADSEILQDGFEQLVEELPAWQPFIALIRENRAVSVCRSVRITPEAHEAGVETLPEFRGNGYARTVVAEWARLVRKSGAIPLYSTSLKNFASQAVARKLGLKCYGVTLNVT